MTTTTDEITEDDVLDAMEKYGGGFIKALAQAWRKADMSNAAILRSSFRKYFVQYKAHAMRDRKQQLHTQG